MTDTAADVCPLCGRDHLDLDEWEQRAYEKVAHDAVVVMDCGGNQQVALVLVPPTPAGSGDPPQPAWKYEHADDTWGWYTTRWEWSPTGWWWCNQNPSGHGYVSADRAQRDGLQALWNWFWRQAAFHVEFEAKERAAGR